MTDEKQLRLELEASQKREAIMREALVLMVKLYDGKLTAQDIFNKKPLTKARESLKLSEKIK
jgi:hypothetical protein